MAKQSSDALLKLSDVRAYKEDKAKLDALRHTLLSIQRVQQDLVKELWAGAHRDIAKARAACHTNAAACMGDLCATFSGDVLLVARGDACVAASAVQLAKSSPHLKALLQESLASGKREIPVLSALFRDGRRVPISSLTLILAALATSAASFDLLPPTDMYAVAEAISLSEHWGLQEVCQRIHNGVISGQLVLSAASSDAVDTLLAARQQMKACEDITDLHVPSNTQQSWDVIENAAFDALSSSVTSTRCVSALANLDAVTVTDILDQDLRPHDELALSGFPKENNSDLMDGVYVKLPDLHDGYPAWKRSDDGRVACAMLKCAAMPSCLGVQGPFWEIFFKDGWQERPMIKMKGSSYQPRHRKQGDASVAWSPATCQLAWEWLSEKVDYRVSTPLAALRAVEELGYRNTVLEQRLLRNAADSDVLGQHAELQLLSPELKEYKRLQECTSWHTMFEEAMAVQLGKRAMCEEDDNPRLRKRARAMDIPQLSAAEVVALCTMGGS
eukprot:CAMPEP_0169164526 /NCGR_PEP_ID=MMETSP1015-20121227/58894_1 /TAXON_ID=342587 /ORGANISM="Karlodinium micrum, Strain CCMP2283" /LENGTH=501 /DNA_ID=CAMNT_0009236993 /DNA_START=53 /DNA_END=1560 /DNA_ORIENTATION=+